MDVCRQSVKWTMKKLSQQSVTVETAQVLLHDTLFRLTNQQSILDEIETSLEEKNSKENSVIPANLSLSLSSDLLDWRNHQQREKLKAKTIYQAAKTFQSLRVLHSDTSNMAKHLLDSESIWQNFEQANQSAIASGMEQIRSRHAGTLETFADLMLNLKICSRILPLERIESFLRGRLSIQILCDHYVALNKRRHGIISVDCCLKPVLEEAITEAKHLCDAHYLISPDVNLLSKETIPKVTIVRPWLHHALVEVLKNSMVSSIQKSGDRPPSIQIRIENEIEEKKIFSNPHKETRWCKIYVQDSGVGLSDSKKAFEFASSSAQERWDRLDEQQSYASVRSPLQSLGVGVPSSQWLMQHFGGNLNLYKNNDMKLSKKKDASFDPNGCTAELKLPLDDSIEEFLPDTNKNEK